MIDFRDDGLMGLKDVTAWCEGGCGDRLGLDRSHNVSTVPTLHGPAKYLADLTSLGAALVRAACDEVHGAMDRNFPLEGP